MEKSSKIKSFVSGSLECCREGVVPHLEPVLHCAVIGWPASSRRGFEKDQLDLSLFFCTARIMTD